MKLNQTTGLQQNLNLTITPKLIQSMHILQLSSSDIVSYVQEQAFENPLLEVVWTENAGNRKSNRGSKLTTSKGTTGSLLELAASKPETLERVLLNQLRLAGLTSRCYNIAKFLAGNLNESGFLAITLEEAAECLQVPQKEVAAALETLQAMDPAGIAARTLQECLLIQIRRDMSPDPWAEPLVSDYINELGAGKWKHLAQVLGISLEQVKQSLMYIRTLNPRPGLAYKHEPLMDMKPDAWIRKAVNGYVIVMNKTGLPQVCLNKQVQQLCSESDSKETDNYVRQHAQTAAWLIHSLEQRQHTLVRVIEAIAEEQLAFLEKGKSCLKPMNLRTIAAKLQLHESTVSRAIQNKAVQTPQGIFELKFFFTTGLSTVDGETASAEGIKSRIRELIEAENKRKPLSDQQITDCLTKEGLQISRRTVMKYREDMQFLSSRLRSADNEG